MSSLSDQCDDLTVEDFEELLADKPCDEKWELIGGRVVKVMVEARWEHNFIIQNLAASVQSRLREAGSTCRTLIEPFLLNDRLLHSSMLPGIIVRSGPLEPGASSLNDACVLVEVTSDGSVGRDRAEKWHVYQRLPSLQHYVLVERDKARVEIFDRNDDAWSMHRILEGLDALLDLPAIRVRIPLAEIYRDVLPPRS